MNDHRVIPVSVAETIEEFVEGEHRDAAKYDNRQVLDESGVFALYRLAATIYAAGYADGEALATRRESAARYRERERNREAAE